MAFLALARPYEYAEALARDKGLLAVRRDRGGPAGRTAQLPSVLPGACLDPNASDYDCADGSGNGPRYTGTVRVVGDDEFGLDPDGDGFGCERS